MLGPLPMDPLVTPGANSDHILLRVPLDSAAECDVLAVR
jgi:hypothetical protein